MIDDGQWMSAHPNLVKVSAILAARKAKDKDTDPKKSTAPSTQNGSGDQDLDAVTNSSDKAKLL